MICAIAAIFQDAYPDVANVHIVFSSAILEETDREVYEKLRQLLNTNVTLHVGTASLQNVRKKDLVILDEADWHLFDDLCDLP